MPKSDPSLQPLTIFLMRDSVERKKLLSAKNLRKIDLGAHGTLYIKRPRNKLPSWASFFDGHVDPEEFGRVKSAAAVLLTVVDGRHFAVVFGNGRYLINQLAIEQRFGLLVTLNAVDPRKIRSIDKAKLDRQGIQSRTQASRDASAEDFGLDFDADLVKAVAGTPLNGKNGETIAGFDSLHVAVRIAFDDLRSKLSAYLKTSSEKTYQKEFAWIDQVAEIRDAALNARLFGALIKELRNSRQSHCWLAPDGLVDWNQVSWFQFGGAHAAPRITELTLNRFIEYIGGTRALKLDVLDRTRVRALRADDSIAHEWPASRCLQAELKYSQKTYLLNAGKWYVIDDEFVASVNKAVSSIEVYDLGLPEYEDTDEGVYNDRAARSSNGRLVLMDADNISHGGGHSRVEFCDLYSKQNEIIHVKRYSGSSVLSHLFSQAAVSGQAFKSDEEFRRKVDAKLPASHKIGDVTRPLQPGEYKVVIVIVGGPNNAADLPFFSRVTLKNSTKLLSALGFKVAVSHIPLEARYALLESLREKQKRRSGMTRKRPIAVGRLQSPLKKSTRIQAP
jgi:uncharacterized protein (TIGR04141 family)